MKYAGDMGELQLDLPFDGASTPVRELLPTYVTDIRERLEDILECADLHLWLMVDRLDEVFPRRSETETRALRALLRTSRAFRSDRIRLKIFLRDDIFEQITNVAEGFTALTHVTARQADSLRWSDDQILTLIINRLFASQQLAQYLDVDATRLKASKEYRTKMFYTVFPHFLRKGNRQSNTLRWIYSHAMDGKDVVTPRDVIDLLERAKQKQLDEFEADSEGECEYIIGPSASALWVR